MAHPTTRVLAVLELLQTHGRLSGADIARRIEVDVRTVRRYVAVLEELGIPITAERGRHGAYQLVPGFKLPPMMFDEDEALALAVGLVAARGLGLAGAAPAVASARAKLERVMPGTLQRRVRAIDETVALDLSPGDAPGDALVTLAAAAQERRRVRLLYRDARGEESERAFDAYGLARRWGHWYAVGRCHLAKGVRSFRLDRVRSVEPLARSFRRPEGFDALRHLASSIAALPRAFSAEVLLRTDLPTAKRHLFETIGRLEERGEGVLLRAEADDLDWFARELARLPFEFEVRRPAGLRTALARRAELLRRAALRGAGARPVAVL